MEIIINDNVIDSIQEDKKSKGKLPLIRQHGIGISLIK